MRNHNKNIFTLIYFFLGQYDLCKQSSRHVFRFTRSERTYTNFISRRFSKTGSSTFRSYFESEKRSHSRRIQRLLLYVSFSRYNGNELFEKTAKIFGKSGLQLQGYYQISWHGRWAGSVLQNEGRTRAIVTTGELQIEKTLNEILSEFWENLMKEKRFFKNL